MPRARVAIAPGEAPAWAAEAVVAGGGDVVGVDAAEALFWLDPFGVDQLEGILAAAPQIGWVQLPWAGVEEFAVKRMFDDGRQWTSGKGVYAEPVAEHALTLALAGLRHIPERVRAASWGTPAGRTLYDARVTILGGGGIARSLLGLLAPFRAETTVVRRRAEDIAGAGRVVAGDGLLDALPSADVVVVALALTPETHGIMGAPQFAAMEDHAWLVNVARGGHVQTDALVAALRDGSIGGAALDVTDPEPLPDGHPLWSLPNCIITPHTADTPEMFARLLGARVRDNVRRFIAGEELIGPVDGQQGY